MFRIPINSEDYPNIIEATEAKKEFTIVQHQPIGLFLSKKVKHFLFTAEVYNCDRASGDRFMVFDAFAYGYILGKRAERARKAERERK